MEGVADRVVGHNMVRDVGLDDLESSGIYRYDSDGLHQVQTTIPIREVATTELSDDGGAGDEIIGPIRVIPPLPSPGPTSNHVRSRTALEVELGIEVST
jgi:hypothetical protein